MKIGIQLNGFTRIAAMALALLMGGTGVSYSNNNDGFDQRRQQLLDQFDGHEIRGHTKSGLLDALARLELAGGGDNEALEYVSRSIPGNAGMFDYPPVAQALFRFSEHFSGEQLERLHHGIRERVHVMIGHGTENHAAMRVAGAYLFGQFFRDERERLPGDADFPSEMLMERAAELLARRGRGFYEVGNEEQLSTTYAMINAYPFLAVQEYAADPELRDVAEALLCDLESADPRSNQPNRPGRGSAV